MRKSIFLLFIAISLLSVILVPIACNNEENGNDENDSTKTVDIRRFSYDDYNFAILEDKEFIQYNKAIYHRGDEVFMVFSNVGPFARGGDSLNHADMKLEVVNAIGEAITVRENFWGEKGHTDFKDDMLSKPYASFTSSTNEKPGKYTMTVTIYDLISNDSLVIYDDFFLE